MKYGKFLVIIAIAVFLMGCPEGTKSDQYKIQGYVVGADNIGIPGVEVSNLLYDYYSDPSLNEKKIDGYSVTNSSGLYVAKVSVIYDGGYGPKSFLEIGNLVLELINDGIVTKHTISISENRFLSNRGNNRK
jgi:hypothetical protein